MRSHTGPALTPQRFTAEYLDRNTPVIIPHWNDMSRWYVARYWVKQGGKGGTDIDWEHLLREHGDEQVPVVSSAAVGDATTWKSSMSLQEYKTDYWSRPDRPYLKDWHACLALGGLELYELPVYFRDDWLNDWLEHLGSDYKFIYIGPAGSRTGVHTDVLHSNSWSAQLTGRKRWLLLPPSHAHLVENELGICNVAEFPDDVRDLCIDIVQSPGEIIFVPAGWYHSVCNLDDSLSVNHNWIDSSSLERSWNHLLKEYRIAAHYIDDVRELTTPDEFAALVDRNAKLQSGMDKRQFFDMVETVLMRETTLVGEDDARHDETSDMVRRRRQEHGRAFLEAHSLP